MIPLLFGTAPLAALALVVGSSRRQLGQPMKLEAIAALETVLPPEQWCGLVDHMKNWISANPYDPINLRNVLWWLDDLTGNELDEAGQAVIRRQAQAFGI